MSIVNGYVESEYIHVFPTTRRIGKATESKYLSEKALTRLINQIIDTDGFVITPEEDFGAYTPFEFNIHGYYIKVDNIGRVTEGFDGKLDIYAKITIDDTDDSDELLGSDDDNNNTTTPRYKGVTFQSTKPESDYWLHILHRDSPVDLWSIAQDGQEKFKEKSFRVDGGIIKKV